MGKEQEHQDKIMVTRASLPPYEEYIAKIKPIWESAWLTNMGSFHQELEQRLKDYMGTDHLVLFVNGHMALEMVIQALDLTGEVITTPFTFASTTHAIVRNGLKPVFCDINPEDYTIDAAKIEALITEKTSAIIPVHVYGNICDVEAIEAIARRHKLRVIYDAAHTFGERYKGKSLAAFGDASIFSFHATKVFNTIEGGAVSYSEEWLGHRLNCLKNYGIVDEDHVVWVGGNAKMNEFQAAMGLCNLDHIDANLEKRKRIVERYRERLADIDWLRISDYKEGLEPNYAYFPIIIQGDVVKREQLVKTLNDNNIFPRKYFYPLTNDFQCYEGEFSSHETPVAADLAGRVLTLPLYADLSLEQVDRICSVIRNQK